MTSISDRLTPPREPLTPTAHYEIADRLLAELSDLRPHELNLPYAKAKWRSVDQRPGTSPSETKSSTTNQPTEGI